MAEAVETAVGVEARAQAVVARGVGGMVGAAKVAVAAGTASGEAATVAVGEAMALEVATRVARWVVVCRAAETVAVGEGAASSEGGMKEVARALEAEVTGTVEVGKVVEWPEAPATGAVMLAVVRSTVGLVFWLALVVLVVAARHAGAVVGGRRIAGYASLFAVAVIRPARGDEL